jgi:hypothetical protein
MSYSQAVETYVGRLVDFSTEVILQEDGGSIYIDAWYISGIPQPTQQEILNLMQDDYQLDKVFETKTYIAKTINDLSLISANNGDTAYVESNGRNYQYKFGEGWISSCMELWEDWNPEITWYGNEPQGVYVEARYIKLKSIVFFDIRISATDGNNASKVTITLPIDAKDNGIKTNINSVEMVVSDTIFGSSVTTNYIGDMVTVDNLASNSIGLSYELVVTGRFETEKE